VTDASVSIFVLLGVSIVQILAAMAFGLWLGRGLGERRAPGTPDEVLAEDVARRLKALSRALAESVGEHRAEVVAKSGALRGLMSTDVHPLNHTVLDVLEQIVAANDRLHRQLAEAEQRLREQAHLLADQRLAAQTDPLTGLANRRAFEARLAEALATAAQQDAPLGALLADIDHFKQINDRFGHAAGDDVLRTVASRMKGALPEATCVARLGGEEFAAILPHGPARALLELAERLRTTIATQRCPVAEGMEAPLSISLGVTRSRKDDTPQSIMIRADQALYSAKNAGRNRTVASDDAAVPAPRNDVAWAGGAQWDQVCGALRERLGEERGIAESPSA
jgi:diguanylate cyclase (GGDEF)-like protein